MKTTKKQMVLSCLEKYPEARNSDIYLLMKVWEQYYYNELEKLDKYLLELYTAEVPKFSLIQILQGFMNSVVNEDDVKRARAEIQNLDLKFLPTNPEIIKQRKKKQLNWREKAL